MKKGTRHPRPETRLNTPNERSSAFSYMTANVGKQKSKFMLASKPGIVNEAAKCRYSACHAARPLAFALNRSKRT